MPENHKTSYSPKPAILLKQSEEQTLPLQGEPAMISPEAGALEDDARPALEMLHCLQDNNQGQISEWLSRTVPDLGRNSLNTKKLQDLKNIYQQNSGQHVEMAYKPG